MNYLKQYPNRVKQVKELVNYWFFLFIYLFFYPVGDRLKILFLEGFLVGLATT